MIKTDSPLIKKMAYKSKTFFEKILKRKIITINPKIKSRGTVLLSYLTKSFTLNLNQSFFHSHTNYWECGQIAQSWLDNGYSVDVIDWDNNKFTPKKDYDVFIDIHSNMERLAPFMKKDCLKILHITGSHWLFQNTAEYSRLLSLQKRKNYTLIPRRTVAPSRGIEYADCATILGNLFTQRTFAYAKKTLYPIHLSTSMQFPFFETKEFDRIRKNYVWFGGGGMIHKGLDLVLEAFATMPEYQLTVCGSPDQETDFCEAYHKELYETPNIKVAGWVDISSSIFSDIVRKNIGFIYPSCSEGQAGSVITCLHAGLIPIISYESGVDLPDFGIILSDSGVTEISQALMKISAMPDADLRIQSKKAWDFAREHHTKKRFKNDYDNFVKIMIEKADH
jgi:glycosyltransferase involved in cell wall biosynthesis